MALINKLTAIADAIRGKTGKTEEMTLDQMVAEIEGISGGDGDETTLFTSVNNNDATSFTATDKMYKLRSYMFYGNTLLKSADLSKLNAPIGNSDRLDLTQLIGSYCFNGCTALESVILPEIETASTSAWIGGRAFMGCSSLKEFVTEKPGTFSTACPQAFASCTSLQRAVLPNFNGSNVANTFNGCTNLELVDLAVGTIGATYFYNCAKFKTLVLRSSAVATLANINAFTGTPFASGGTGGTVYVPSALISSYQTATNWSTLYAVGTCNFVAIEGSEYE